jgi:hypothetical protein
MGETAFETLPPLGFKVKDPRESHQSDAEVVAQAERIASDAFAKEQLMRGFEAEVDRRSSTFSSIAEYLETQRKVEEKIVEEDQPALKKKEKLQLMYRRSRGQGKGETTAEGPFTRSVVLEDAEGKDVQVTMTYHVEDATGKWKAVPDKYEQPLTNEVPISAISGSIASLKVTFEEGVMQTIGLISGTGVDNSSWQQQMTLFKNLLDPDYMAQHNVDVFDRPDLVITFLFGEDGVKHAISTLVNDNNEGLRRVKGDYVYDQQARAFRTTTEELVPSLSPTDFRARMDQVLHLLPMTE